MNIRKSQDIKFEVKGADLQYVEVYLQPGQSVISEPGAMMYMEQGIQMSTKLGDGSEKHSGVLGTIMGMGKRYMAGEDFFITFFTNNGNKEHKVSFAGNYPGRIYDIDLNATREKCIYCQRGSFLCGAKGVSLEMGFSKKIGFGLFGGEGFILQKLTGDGAVFIHASGGMEEKSLEPGETLYVDTGSLVGFEKGVEFDIQMVKGLKNMLFGGEDLFLTTLKGPGKVWIQSLPYYRLIGGITANVLKVLSGKKG